MYRLGDEVEVKLVEVAPIAGALRFEMMSEGRVLAKRDRPKVQGGRHPFHARGKSARGHSRGR
jgi:ribonuclease R